MNRSQLVINLDKISENVSRIRSHLKAETLIMAVIKADAYGCGAVEIAQHLSALHVNYFGVATSSEAIKLRQHNIKLPILLLSEPLDVEVLDCLQHGVEFTVYSIEFVEQLNKLGQQLDQIIPVQVKLNSGLNRLGVEPRSFQNFLERLQHCSNLKLNGIYSHFVESHKQRSEKTQSQIKLFHQSVKPLAEQNKTDFLTHMSNSAAVLNAGEYQCSMVRVGIEFYKDALTFQSTVIHIVSIKKGESVSYDARFIAQEDTRIAIIGLGYADGISTISDNASVLINGQQFPIVGRICMDMSLVDIGDADIAVKDLCVFIGRSGDKSISLSDWSQWSQKNPREFLCGIGSRVTRKYE